MVTKRIKDEQEFMAIFRDEDSNIVYEHEKVFLLSRVISIDRHVFPHIGDDDRPKTYVYTKDGGFIILCPYPQFKRTWLAFRQQGTQVFNNIFMNQ